MYKTKRRRITIENRGTKQIITLEEKVSIKMPRKSMIFGKDFNFNYNFKDNYSPEDARTVSAQATSSFGRLINALTNTHDHVEFNGSVNVNVNVGGPSQRNQLKENDTKKQRPIIVKGQTNKRKFIDVDDEDEQDEDDQDEDEENDENKEAEKSSDAGKPKKADEADKSLESDEFDDTENLGFGDEHVDTIKLLVKVHPSREIRKAKRNLKNSANKSTIVPASEVYGSQVYIPETPEEDR